ncbi:MAG: peptidyl-prolyl cis-trans isomerase [Paludibacter sp.]|nr:peptidyl-prolyl cis-trans isomerase [Paludibacter sp.]
MNKYFTLVFVALSMVVLSSCNRKAPEVESKPLLEVEGKFLYLDDLEQVIPANVNKKDSTEIAQSYIRKWITDVLMYENAKRNITNQAEIDELVEDYRKTLTIHQYQQKMIVQRLPKEPTEEELKAFYDQYSEQLVLKENIIKGLLLVVPTKAPKLSNVRSWVQSGNTKSLESIEKYSIQNAISYDYFGDKWIPFTDILKKIPIQIEDPANFISSNRFIETSDSLKHYFLRIESFSKIGEVEPYEMAKVRIVNILMNKHKADFISNFEKELYNDAIKDETVTFFK